MSIMEQAMQEQMEGALHEQEQLYKELEELENKCKNSTDYFFIYGWQKRIEEIKRKLKM